MEKKDEERAIEMTGGTAANLGEALDQWDNEREMIGQLHDENQAYTIAFRRFDLAMSMASKVISQVEQDAGLFITPKTRSEIQQFREQVAKLQATPAKFTPANVTPAQSAGVSRGRSGATRTIAQEITLAPHTYPRSEAERDGAHDLPSKSSAGEEVSAERKKPNAKQTHTNSRESTRRRKPGKGSP